MRMVSTLLLFLAASLNSIGCSSQSGRNPSSEPNYVGSSSAGPNSLDRISLVEPPLRERSRSPRTSPPKVLGYSLKELGHLRLIPRRKPEWQFEFRKYVFPAGKSITMRAARVNYAIVPDQEHLVLSTSNGEIFALLDYSGILRGVYRMDPNFTRVKIIMTSGAIQNMTPAETFVCPVGKNHPIFPQTFLTVFANDDSLQSDGMIPISNFNIKCTDVCSSSGRQQSPDQVSPENPSLSARPKSSPGRPPTDKVLGYSFEQLGYVRLVPRSNQFQRFEFRRYVFPVEKLLLLLEGNGKFVPVPNREHIVLSTSSGDIFSILEYTGIFRGIYKVIRKTHPRMKINMVSREVAIMSENEMKECRVGKIFPNQFLDVFANDDSLNTYQ